MVHVNTQNAYDEAKTTLHDFDQIICLAAKHMGGRNSLMQKCVIFANAMLTVMSHNSN